MKKAIIIITSFGLIGLIIMGILLFTINNPVIKDRINPFIEMNEYYTVVDTEGKHLGKDKIREDKETYQYEFTAYNESGKKQNITINVTKKLREGAYLEVIAKGHNGKSWAEVKESEIPQQAQEKLN